MDEPTWHPELIVESQALETLVAELKLEPIIALDSESNSFHAYRERVCLLQLSTRTRDFIIDPLAVDPRPLVHILCDGREVVLHGADYDVRCLRREYGWRMPRLFDTMIAARKLGRPALGLAALVETRFGIHLSKSFQRSDWGRRPLGKDQLRYAALDTHYLLPLYDELVLGLERAGQLHAARQEFDRVAAAEPRERSFNPEGWQRMRGARDLGPTGRSVLRGLFLAREEQARALDRPPFKVIGDEAMLGIAQTLPSSVALARVPGVTPLVLKKLGARLLDVVGRATARLDA